MYGKYMTPSAFKTCVEREALVNGYQSAYADSLGITDEDIQAYYEENASTLDTYDYRYIYLSGKAASTTDEDGNTVEPTEEETKAAMEAAKAKADAFVAAVNSSDDKETAFAELAPDYVSEGRQGGTMRRIPTPPCTPARWAAASPIRALASG